MLKPLWGIAGVAVLGTAGIAGALVVASSGGEEEVVQQVETATGSASTPQQECDQYTPAPGEMVWRWGDVIMLIPADREIVPLGTSIQAPLGTSNQRGDGNFSVARKTDPGQSILVDSKTGLILSRPQGTDAAEEKGAEIERAVATIHMCPLDVATAPWPYTGEPTGIAPQKFMKIQYLEPDPISGIQVLRSVRGDLGPTSASTQFLLVVNSRTSYVEIDAETGELVESRSRIDQMDADAFNRYIRSVTLAVE